MLYKYGKPTHNFMVYFYFCFISIFSFLFFWGGRGEGEGIFNKTILLLALVGYEMVIANPTLLTRDRAFFLSAKKKERHGSQITTLRASLAIHLLISKSRS